ncbi:MAG: outer membrane protein assembly factor BamA, partial [Nitrospirae bacterium]|nr:outer membrane protein assembly factor BamA [Nitrospirota bacterium]
SLKIFYQMGEFSNVVVSTEEVPGGILLKFTLYKKLRIGAIRWNGNTSFSGKILEDYLKIKVDDELSPGWEVRFKKQLLTFYEKEGYFNVEIDSFTAPFEIPSRRLIHILIKEGNQSTIGRIYFTGDLGIPEKTLFDALRIHAGFYYSKTSVQAYLEELIPIYLRKRFLKIKFGNPILHPQSSGIVDLEIPVEAGPQITISLSFTGKRHYLELTLLKQIAIDDEKSVDESVLEESVKRLIEFYRNEGFPFVEITAERQELSGGKLLRAHFKISEGPRVILQDLSFTGNRSISDRLLRNTISHQKTGLWIPRTIRLPVLTNDIESLMEVYRTNGFLFTEVKEHIRYSEDRKRGFIDFEITEGVRSLIQSVEIEGISPQFLPEVEKIIHTRNKGNYYTGTILQDKIAIISYYHKKGFADATVEATASFNDRKDLAMIRFKVDEGSVIKVGHIQLSGNETTHPKVILREINFKSGDDYQEEILLKNQRMISRLGYFQSVRIHPLNPDEEEIRRDVEILVKERNAGAVEFGAGYADVERFNGFAELSHKNIAGTGRRASIRTEISQIGNKEIMSYTEPWIFDFPIDARSAIYYESKFNPNVDYTSTTLGGSIGIEKSIWEFYKLSLLYQNENVRFIDVPANAQLTDEDKSHTNISSVNPSIIRDTRDNFLNPGTGSLNAVWLRWAAQFMGSETQEVKISLQTSWFFPVGPSATVAFSARGGIAYNFGETLNVPISERFMMGGRSTVRGYSENTLGTPGQTLASDTLSPLGGESMALFNWELRYNFPNSLGLVLFMDSGNVWESYHSGWSSPLKSSVGPGVRYNTPVGPLRLDLGFKLNKEPGESSSEFHFTIGHAF